MSNSMNTTTMARTVERARSRLDGQLLLPGDTGYDDARTVWNAMVDRRPRLIVRCASTGDVALAVLTARELGLEIGVRCGGHGITGMAVPDGGLMIDLTPMGGVRVDPARRRAWVQGGALLGALDRASQRYGLATTAGNVSHTGAGGLTLGGGMGWLARQYGLACDNVISFEMVTAQGSIVTASQDENPDLYWGLRGGGGNFGVVTTFEFRLHPVGTRALVAEYTFPLDQALPVLRTWRDLHAGAPRQATFTALASDGMVTVGFVWVGDPAPGLRLIPAMRALGHPLAQQVSELPYLELQQRDDTARGHAMRCYWKGHYLPGLPDEAIEAFVLRGTADGRGDDLPEASLQAYGGAIAEVADTGTAFGHRGTMFEYSAATSWTDATQDETRIAVTRRCAAGLGPYASGVYVNALSDEGNDGVRRAYPGDNLSRLTLVKDAYDPGNVFHLNHNIAPSEAAAGRGCPV
jgi:FAD/FMN-containing dehydrogenase